MQAKEIILIGGSAGSYELILSILETLPSHFNAAIAVVIHRNPNYETQIEDSLTTKLQRDVLSIMDKTEILENTIYFAPPGYHVMIEPNLTFSLDVSEHINYSRPSIDVLFESAAEIYKEKCKAFLLSGANHDGANGLASVYNHLGKIFIHDPSEAHINIMPNFGLSVNPAATILTKQEIIKYFNNLS